MSNVFPRDFKSMPMRAEFSANELIESGAKYYDDLSAGAGITCLGHSNDEIKEAMREQIYSMPYVHAMNWSNKPAEELAAELIRLVTRGTTNSKFNGGSVIFLNTGAESVEAACKLGAQVGYELGVCSDLYGREYSYHGNTFFTLGLGDHPKKKLYPNLDKNTKPFRFPAYRPTVGDTPKMSLTILREYLRSTTHTQSIVVIEPVGGTTIGIEPSTTEYLTGLFELCHDAQAILIYDEVLCGNYRTGELFAYQHYKAPEPDIICLGKGLTGGYFPLSAVIVSKPLVDIIKVGSGKLWHSTTNQNHPVGCAAGVVALKEYELIKHNLPKFGADLKDLVNEIFSGTGVKCAGVGSLLGLRLDPELPGLHLAVRKEALKQGLVLYTDGGTIHGKGNMLLLAPPYTYMEDMLHLEECLVKLRTAIQQVGTVG